MIQRILQKSMGRAPGTPIPAQWSRSINVDYLRERGGASIESNDGRG
jgi:hypothetical protein